MGEFSENWEIATGRGGERIVRFWGKTYHRVRPPKPVLEAQKVGLVWSVPVPCMENARANKGGGMYHGAQTRYWEGVLRYVFLYPEFSTPLCFPLRKFGERSRGNTNRGNRPEVLRGKSASERVSEREGFQRFSEVLFRCFQRSSEVFRGFQRFFRGPLSEPLSECHFPLRVAGPVAPNRVAP